MTAYADSRPRGLDVPFRPGNSLSIELTWPTGELTGRTFTSTLDGVALDLAVNGDVMTIEATEAQTEAVVDPADWLLTETTGGASNDLLLGTWVPSMRSGVSNSLELTVVLGEINVDVSVVSGQASIVALDGRLDTAETDIDDLEAADTAFDIRVTSAEGRLTTAETNITSLTDQLVTHPANPNPSLQNLVGWSADPGTLTGSQIATNGTVYLIKIPISKAATVTNIYWVLSAQATSPVSSQNFVGLYSSAGSRLATTDVGSSTTTTGLKTTAIASTPLTAGFVWVAFVFNASTAPTPTKSAATMATTAGLTAATARWATAGTSQTSLPLSITPSSNNPTAAQNNAYWAAIS